MGLCIVISFYVSLIGDKTDLTTVGWKNNFQALFSFSFFPFSFFFPRTSKFIQMTGIRCYHDTGYCIAFSNWNFFFLSPWIVQETKNKVIILLEKVHWRKANLYRRINIASGIETQLCISNQPYDRLRYAFKKGPLLDRCSSSSLMCLLP